MSGLNVKVLDDAVMEGTAKFNELGQEVEEEYAAPATKAVQNAAKAQFVAFWEKLDPRALAAAEQADPQQFAAFKAQYEQFKKELGR
jgi:hypothetical protein